MPVGKFKADKVFFAVCLLILIGALAYESVLMNRPVPLPALPNPNGNDDFVKAQKLIVGSRAELVRESLETLRKHVVANAEALKLVRDGLTKQCRVPLSFSTNYFRLRSLSDVKRVAYLLEAEGRVAELEGRTNAAARIYVETVRYGQESCRGGVIVERLVGIACESLGVNSLQRITGTLDAGTCRASSKELQEMERRKESATDVLRNESEWVRRTFPVWQRLPGMIPFESLNPMIRVRKSFGKKCQQSEVSFQRLILDLASRAYELDRGLPPKNVNELVPDYLDAVPVDPTTGFKLPHLP